MEPITDRDGQILGLGSDAFKERLDSHLGSSSKSIYGEESKPQISSSITAVVSPCAASSFLLSSLLENVPFRSDSTTSKPGDLVGVLCPLAAPSRPALLAL